MRWSRAFWMFWYRLYTRRREELQVRRPSGRMLHAQGGSFAWSRVIAAETGSAAPAARVHRLSKGAAHFYRRSCRVVWGADESGR